METPNGSRSEVWTRGSISRSSSSLFGMPSCPAPRPVRHTAAHRLLKPSCMNSFAMRAAQRLLVSATTALRSLSRPSWFCHIWSRKAASAPAIRSSRDANQRMNANASRRRSTSFGISYGVDCRSASGASPALRETHQGGRGKRQTHTRQEPRVGHHGHSRNTSRSTPSRRPCHGRLPPDAAHDHSTDLERPAVWECPIRQVLCREALQGRDQPLVSGNRARIRQGRSRQTLGAGTPRAY